MKFWPRREPEAVWRLFVNKCFYGFFPPIAQISPESFAFAPGGWGEGGRAVFHFGHRHKCGSPGAINAFSDLSGNNNNNNSGAIAQNAHERIPREGPSASVRPTRSFFSHRSSWFFLCLPTVGNNNKAECRSRSEEPALAAPTQPVTSLRRRSQPSAFGPLARAYVLSGSLASLCSVKPDGS